MVLHTILYNKKNDFYLFILICINLFFNYYLTIIFLDLLKHNIF